MSDIMKQGLSADQIAQVQRGVADILKDVKREKLEHTLAAKYAEQERVALSAAAVGVSAEDYHKWASGRQMPEVAAKVAEFMGKR